MPDPETRRLQLYNSLQELLGPEPAETLMSYLPATTELATRADIQRVEGRLDRIEGRMERLEGELKSEIRHLSGRIDRLQQTTFAGFVALIAAVIASGLLS